MITSHGSRVSTGLSGSRRAAGSEAITHRVILASVPPTFAGHHGRQHELPLEFLPPLLGQARRHDHKCPVGKAAHPQLRQHQPCLDRLAEPDLVGENRPAPHPAQHRLRRLPLVVEGLEVKPWLGQQSVKPRPAPHLRSGFDQAGALPIDWRTLPQDTEKGQVRGQDRGQLVHVWRSDRHHIGQIIGVSPTRPDTSAPAIRFIGRVPRGRPHALTHRPPVTRRATMPQ